jgi:hypothetical protein
MATADQRAALRRMVDDVSAPQSYDDATLDLYIEDAGDDLRIAAGAIWREKAAKYVEMVDTQEGTSRRALGDMLEHALKAAEAFEGTETPGSASATTRAIERV